MKNATLPDNIVRHLIEDHRVPAGMLEGKTPTGLRCPVFQELYRLHGDIHRGKVKLDGVIDDPRVKRYEPPAPGTPVRWVSTADLASATTKLAGKLPPDAAGVAGIPRSGMMPAAQLSTLLHLPLFELTDEGVNQLGCGVRGRGQRFGFEQRPGSPLVVVDDTVYSGTEMRWAKGVIEKLRLHAVFVAAFARPEQSHEVHHFGEVLPCPHLLEWNIVNCGPFGGNAANAFFGGGIALDFDGIVCHDAESGGPLGGPYLVPRTVPAKLIATGRHERSRPLTEAWLRKWGVEWERLVMLPDHVECTWVNAALHKARHYRDSDMGLFIESCPVQAERIHELTRKPVACPRIGKVWS